jgi:RNase P/RNase MRP subunit p29
MSDKRALLLMGELIGEDTEIVKSSQREQSGMQGKIIDETLNTIIIETKNGVKTIQKNAVTLKIKGEEIKGSELLFRPEDRIKKYWRKFDATMRRQELPKTRGP